jgi:sugar transferase EpsL
VLKRIVEWTLVLVAAPLLVAALAVVALLVAVRLGRPVIFRQQRPGLKGRLFTLYKFRTMADVRDGEGNLQPDAVRLTRFGRWLRSTSLDELPSLLNFVRGEIALVGPRPLLPDYLPLYSPAQARRHDVRPGLTGWAQVNGRNALGWDERLALDIWYVDNRSLWLDLRIIGLTLLRVLRRDGINAQGDATMTRFTGPGS